MGSTLGATDTNGPSGRPQHRNGAPTNVAYEAECGIDMPSSVAANLSNLVCEVPSVQSDLAGISGVLCEYRFVDDTIFGSSE